MLILLPPSIIGIDYTNTVFAVLILLILFYTIKYNILNRPAHLGYLIGLTWFIYLLVQNLILSPSSTFLTAINRLLPSLVVFFITLKVLKTSEHHKVFKVITIFTVIMSISGFFSFLLIIAGFGDRIILYSDITSETLDLFFPFTLAEGFGRYYLFNIRFPRLNGIFNEPGIYQAYLIISYYYIDKVFKKHNVIYKYIIIINLILTFSFAGYAIFLALLFYQRLFRTQFKGWLQVLKNYIATIILISSIYPVYQLEFINRKVSIAYDVQDAGTTYSRYVVTTAPFGKPLEGNRIFGLGFLNKDKLYERVGFVISGTNMIAGISGYGFLGFTLLVLYSIISLKYNYDKRTIYLVIPFILTAAVAQDVYLSAIYYLVLNLRGREIS